MKIQVSQSNAPIWHDATVIAELPSKLKPLDILSKNLWWVWNSEAKTLFHDIDPDLWRKTGENPVMMLQRIKSERLSEIMKDEAMMDRIKNVYDDFKEYMKVPMRKDVPSVSYFSMEYGLCNCLKIYSGGLGVLAGDYIKEASDSCVDMTAVGFLYRYGYFTQTLSVDGQQIANYEPQNFNQLPITQVLDEDGKPMILEVPFPGRVIYSHIWKVSVGRMNLYLMDTDFDMNSEFDRPITHKLYGGDWENRIKQEYMLGIGGVLMLKKLGIKSKLYHCNEGHAALLNLQRLVDFVQEENLDFNTALELVRASSLYTVHTPVPAGHDYFDEALFYKYMNDGWWYEGYRFDEKAGWALTDKRTFTDQSQQDKLDAATIYSMLENEIIPLYFAKNSKGYSPEWIQYIKGSIGHIAPHFTMKRMIDDYIERFYDPEARRFHALSTDNNKLAKEIVAWKESVVEKWDGVKVLDYTNTTPASSATGENYEIEFKIDTNGIGRDLGLEYVSYKIENGNESLYQVIPFKITKEDGNLITFKLDDKIKDAGVYRYGFRLYPFNPNLAHRQDFAYVRWI